MERPKHGSHRRRWTYFSFTRPTGRSGRSNIFSRHRKQPRNDDGSEISASGSLSGMGVSDLNVLAMAKRKTGRTNVCDRHYSGGSVLLGFTAPTGKFASEMSFPETADTPLLRGYRQRRARVQHGRHSWSTSAYPMPGDEMPQAMSRTIVCIRVTVSVDATGYCDDLRRLRIELI